jgi:hypothetical protein
MHPFPVTIDISFNYTRAISIHNLSKFQGFLVSRTEKMQTNFKIYHIGVNFDPSYLVISDNLDNYSFISLLHLLKNDKVNDKIEIQH